MVKKVSFPGLVVIQALDISLILDQECITVGALMNLITQPWGKLNMIHAGFYLFWPSRAF